MTALARHLLTLLQRLLRLMGRRHGGWMPPRHSRAQRLAWHH